MQGFPLLQLHLSSTPLCPPPSKPYAPSHTTAYSLFNVLSPPLPLPAPAATRARQSRNRNRHRNRHSHPENVSSRRLRSRLRWVINSMTSSSSGRPISTMRLVSLRRSHNYLPPWPATPLRPSRPPRALPDFHQRSNYINHTPSTTPAANASLPHFLHLHPTTRRQGTHS